MSQEEPTTENENDDVLLTTMNQENEPSMPQQQHQPLQEKQKQRQYCGRKPKWWTQLAGRRGTPSQRQAMQRMTTRGYCVSKDVLNDFSRVNNRANAKRKNIDVAFDGSNRLDDTTRKITGDAAHDYCHNNHNDEWKRAWWNRSLGIKDDADSKDGIAPTVDPSISSNNTKTPSNVILSNGNEKYAHKIQQMYNHKNPLPPKKYQKTWLEIGFGNGVNLLENARNHPDDLFLGCEIHQPGICTLLRQMELEMGLLTSSSTTTNGDDDDQSTISQASSTREYPSSSLFQNIRILPGDGIKMLSHLPSNYLDVIMITFPDPWPRDCHAHWRVIQQEVVRELHRVLKTQCGRAYTATDAECFDSWTRDVFRQESTSICNNNNGIISSDSNATTSQWKEIVPCPDRSVWLPVVSYYEQKGLEEGRSTMLQCWQCL